jgi:hypothetical protein
VNWTLLATISSMVAFWVTALFILYQIRHMQVARNVEVTMRMFEWAESSRMREAMRWVATKFDAQSYLSQPEDERSDYPDVLIAFFEQAGIMLQKRFVNEDVVLDHLALNAVANWNRLKPLIEHERRQTGDDRVGEHFEFLYQRAKVHEAKHRKGMKGLRD